MSSNEITHPKKVAMLLALHKTIGVVTPACEQVDITPWTHYDWLKKDEHYAESVKAIKSVAKDFAESKLHLAMKKGNIAAIIFYLKTQAKDRGYIEKQEIDMSGNISHTGKVSFYIPDNGRDKPKEQSEDES